MILFWDQKSGFDDCDDDCTDYDDIDNAEVGLKCFLQVTFAYKKCILYPVFYVTEIK